MRTSFGILVFCTVYAATPDNWPQWRGPSNDGIARGDAPLTWSDSARVAWKVSVPGRGNSTPVIWGDRIFLTTAIPTGTGQEHKFVLLSIDRRSGKLIWERIAKTAVPHEGHHQMYGSFASNSPATDGKYVYAFFGSRGVYCYDFEGKLIWSRDLPPMHMRMEFGEGVAPTLAGDRLILNFDQQRGSHIVVLDKITGKDLWRQDRDEIDGWAQPLVVRHGGRDQVIVAATKKVRSYDLETGKLIWECAGLGMNPIPAPVERNGVVYVMSGFRNPNMLAIKLGREGDLTGTDAVLWTNQRGNPYTPSPVLDGDKLYVVTDNGQVSCFDAPTGKPFYQQQRLPKPYNFKASPVAANGRLYLATEEGDVVVLKLGEKYEVLATNTLGDQSFIASPIIADGSIYLRSRTTLFCIH